MSNAVEAFDTAMAIEVEMHLIALEVEVAGQPTHEQGARFHAYAEMLGRVQGILAHPVNRRVLTAEMHAYLALESGAR